MADMLGDMFLFFFGKKMCLIFKRYIKKGSSYSSLFTSENKNLFHHENNGNQFCFI